MPILIDMMDKEIADDKKNWFDIEKYLNRKMKLKPDDEFEVIDVEE